MDVGEASAAAADAATGQPDEVVAETEGGIAAEGSVTGAEVPVDEEAGSQDGSVGGAEVPVDEEASEIPAEDQQGAAQDPEPSGAPEGEAHDVDALVEADEWFASKELEALDSVGRQALLDDDKRKTTSEQILRACVATEVRWRRTVHSAQ